MTRMIQVVRPLMEESAHQLHMLLEQSRAALAPLEEPFDLDFGLHRWLDAEREEAYSDWLEWVIWQAKTPTHVFRLFGLPSPNNMLPQAPLGVTRECCIPHGHRDREGRLDLVISYGDHAIIAVELKKGDAEDADTGKHRGCPCSGASGDTVELQGREEGRR